MGKVFLSLSMSLDGYVAGPNDEIKPLHDWLFNGDTVTAWKGPALHTRGT
jgi:hypothetical protein